MVDLVQPGGHGAGTHLVEAKLGQLPKLLGLLDAQFVQTRRQVVHLPIGIFDLRLGLQNVVVNFL
jgi:hypothetical protein